MPTIRAISSHFPVAVDVLEAELAKPVELRLDVEQAIRAVFPVGRVAESVVEAAMQTLGRGGDVLEIAEHPAWLEDAEDLAVQRSLTDLAGVADASARGSTSAKRCGRSPLSGAHRYSWRRCPGLPYCPSKTDPETGVLKARAHRLRRAPRLARRRHRDRPRS